MAKQLDTRIIATLDGGNDEFDKLSFQSWKDCRLTWNASEYGDLSSLVVPFNKIWTPDLAIYDR